MSDFIEVGDEILLKAEGFPVGKARVVNITERGLYLSWEAGSGEIPYATFNYTREEY